jgi:putative acetyltransferase
MLIEAEDGDFATLLRGEAPHGLKLVDTEIAPPGILQMLRELTKHIRLSFAPSAWLVVKDGELVGLCSLTRVPSDGAIDIGYGIAPSRQGQGYATCAVAAILKWAYADPRVTAITAETSVHNRPSQSVLERNGFLQVGKRVDAEDGDLICWKKLVIPIQAEAPEDVDTIRSVISEAFKELPYSSGTEAAIVDALRSAGALTVSLVATQADQIIGHIALSPVMINGEAGDCYGLGPVSVLPRYQRKGIGSALIHQGLDRLRSMNAQGCVVLGDPSYYRRFGFVRDPELRYADVPPEYFQLLCFTEFKPEGQVTFHSAFEAT